ncbi:MAG: type II toxin-antitoxin system Phd/YefM family antitoxin [Capsulimonadaceae bacterium]
MTSITATYAKNNIGDVWEMAKHEPVEVRSNGIPVAFIVSPEQFQAYHRKHHRLGRPRRLGLLAEEFQGVDWKALLDTDVSDAFSEYLP